MKVYVTPCPTDVRLRLIHELGTVGQQAGAGDGSNVGRERLGFC
jgi:hypothetical protein